MKPKIDKTRFGSVTIRGNLVEYDIVIRLNGTVEKRKKNLSKEIYGTSHIISVAEAKYIYQDGAKCLIIGSGQDGMVKLSDDACTYFNKKGIQVEILDSQASVTRARFNVVAALADYNSALAMWIKATGRNR